MTTPVNFELAKLLKEKEFKEIVNNAYSFNSEKANVSNGEFSNKGEKYISAPTIAEVVMWLYEKHGIWVSVEMTGSKKFYPRGRMIDKKGQHFIGDFKYEGERIVCNSPTKAYEAAIEYTLNNLL